MRFGGALLAFCLASFAAQAATYVRLQSQPGDPTGDGEQRVEYTADPSAYSMTVVPNAAGGVDFLRTLPCKPVCPSSSDYTSIEFAPAAGQAFVAGSYAGVQKFSRTPGSRPGLLVDEQARNVDRCATITGSFVVHDIVRAGDGSVARFAADFEQHCNGQAPALYGAVRFNSDVPYQQPVLYAPVAARFVSEPGDPIGLGETGAFVVLDGQSSSWNSLPNGVHLLLRDAFGASRWSFDFTTGNADPFQPNFGYANAAMPGSSVGTPTLQVRRDGQTCSSYAEASFFVFETEWSPEGLLLRFAADVNVLCTGAAGRLSAGVRYNSTVPYIPPAKTGAAGNLPNGGALALSFDSPSASCVLQTASFVHPDFAPLPVPAPKFVAYPYGLMTFSTDNCGTGAITFHVDVAEDLPPTAQWWQFGPTIDNSAGHWYPLPSRVDGKRLSFTINDGEIGDNTFTRDGKFAIVGLIAIPGGVMQDLWWSGLAENGWGLSLVQHRDILFGNLFVYDASGAPTWYVMPSGSWDATHTVYTGALYLPRGSPFFFAYDASRFAIGAAVGVARLTFADANHATFEYTIDGVAGRKDIVRIPFGPTAPPTDIPYGDLWWAGIAQNGWGIALHQQFANLFGLWFTYDANGKATWFVMPAGDWFQKGDYRGKIYRVVGPPWLGVPYDATRHHTIEAGTFRFFFSGDTGSFDYTVDGRSGSIPLSRIPF